LGLDNHPLARYRYDFEDTLSPLRVTFTDLSNYEPDTWHWDFGDGTTYDTTASGEIFHTFPHTGLYTVCLTVSNAYSADTICYDIQVGEISGTESPGTDASRDLSVYPNPVRHLATLHVGCGNGNGDGRDGACSVSTYQRVDVRLYNSLGQCVNTSCWRGSTGQIPVGGLPGGIYRAVVNVEDRFAGSVEVVKY
jgi:PKD repeat protein